tara:strand:- start:270 stop:671 length:402 start_codon:yes stop_codon:yes gene_type:complete
MPTENRKARKFIDFDLNFRADDQTKDITESVNENAVKQALKSLLLTKNYERKFHPEIGCQIFSMMFENFTPSSVNIMKRTIQDVVSSFEPRATLLRVDIVDNPDQNEIDVTVEFKMANIPAPLTITETLTRAR